MSDGKPRISVIKGDITKIEVDAIVNAANPSLMGGGGVDGAIHRNGGNEIIEECKVIVANNGRCNPGEAVVTNAGKLPAKKIIHTVGPVWHGGHDNEPELLQKSYISSLTLAEENHCQTVAFPNISTGVYGFPKQLAAEQVKIALSTHFQNGSSIREIIFVCFDDENYEIYSSHFNSN